MAGEGLQQRKFIFSESWELEVGEGGVRGVVTLRLLLSTWSPGAQPASLLGGKPELGLEAQGGEEQSGPQPHPYPTDPPQPKPSSSNLSQVR